MYNKEDVDKAITVLKEGGIILYPTDTIWGIGCDATNAEAVKKIYDLKRRSDSKAMLALVDGLAMLERYVDEVPAIAYQLVEVADNPLTIIYDGARGLAPNLIADDGSIGLRITNEIFSKELCKRLRKPIVSTSANISGGANAEVFSDIPDVIKEGVDYVVDYRRNDTTKARPSNIIKVRPNGEIKIIR